MSLFIGRFRRVQKKDVKMRGVFVLCISISLFSVNCAGRFNFQRKQRN